MHRKIDLSQLPSLCGLIWITDLEENEYELNQPRKRNSVASTGRPSTVRTAEPTFPWTDRPTVAWTHHPTITRTPQLTIPWAIQHYRTVTRTLEPTLIRTCEPSPRWTWESPHKVMTPMMVMTMLSPRDRMEIWYVLSRGHQENAKM